jgi:hypothetical protein
MRAVALAALLLLAAAGLPAVSADVAFGGFGSTPGESDDGTAQCAEEPIVYPDDNRGDPYYCIAGTYVPGVCIVVCGIGVYVFQQLESLIDKVNGATNNPPYCVPGQQPGSGACLAVGGGDCPNLLTHTAETYVRCFVHGTGPR